MCVLYRFANERELNTGCDRALREWFLGPRCGSQSDSMGLLFLVQNASAADLWLEWRGAYSCLAGVTAGVCSLVSGDGSHLTVHRTIGLSDYQSSKISKCHDVFDNGLTDSPLVRCIVKCRPNRCDPIWSLGQRLNDRPIALLNKSSQSYGCHLPRIPDTWCQQF